METPRATLLPVEAIIALLPATFEGWPFCQPARPATDASVARIEAQLAVTLPPLLLRISGESASYGYWFNSVGNDYRNENHILRTNERFRAVGVPDRYVIFAQGFDGECDAWDLGSPLIDGEAPIALLHVDDDGILTGPTGSFGSFHAYMDALCRRHAKQCPVDALRHAAIELLASH